MIHRRSHLKDGWLHNPGAKSGLGRRSGPFTVNGRLESVLGEFSNGSYIIHTYAPASVHCNYHPFLTTNACKLGPAGDHRTAALTNLSAVDQARSSPARLRMLILPTYFSALLHKTTSFAGCRLTILLSIPVLVATLSLLCSYICCTHIVNTMPSIFKAFALGASLQISQLGAAQTTFDSSATICEYIHHTSPPTNPHVFVTAQESSC